MRGILLPLLVIWALLDVTNGLGSEGCTKLDPVDDLRITNTPSMSIRPSLVWNGTEYGLAWQEGGGTYEIFFARLDANGNKLGDNVQVTEDLDQSWHASLVWADTQYGIAWGNGFEEIFFARLDASGNKLGSDIRIVQSSYAMDPSLVWNGAGYGLAWEDERDGHGEIYFARLNPWGRKIGEDVRVSQATYPNGPSLVWTGTGYGVVWREWSCGGDEIRFARLDASGNKLNPEVEVKHACYLLHPSLAWNGSQYGVVWEDACDSPGNDMDVYFTRLDSTGDTLGDVARITYQPSDLKYPSPVWADSEYGVAWSGDTKMYLTRLTALGYKIGDFQLSSDVSDMSYANRSSLVWTGTRYGAAWADTRDGNPEIYFAHMECSCSDADDDNDGFSGCDGDCSDQDSNSYPNAPELCDGNNNDCNETIPSDEIDHDGDQYVECQGWNDIQGDNPEILGGGDCDPSNPQAYPGAPEICDEADNNCSDLQDLNDPELIADFDSDGDGLPDCWELYGLDANEPDLICRSASPADCDLPLNIDPYRANRTRKDIYVEIDYMDCAEGGCAPDHDPSQTHRPLNSTLSNAVAAFFQRGVDLHFIGGQGLLDEPVPEIEPILFGPSSGPGPADDFWDLKWGSQQPQDPCTVGPTGAHFGTIADRTAPNCIDRIDARRLVFRYAIAGHSSPSGGGRAEINGNDLLLGLGGAHKARAARDVAQHWGTTFEKEWLDMEAGILMHELGHTLNLHHGGSDSSGNPVESPGCKPNHLSVMNFARVWNLAGLSVGLSGLPDGTPVRAKRKLDYSPEILPPVRVPDSIGSAGSNDLGSQEDRDGRHVQRHSVGRMTAMNSATHPRRHDGNGVCVHAAVRARPPRTRTP